MSNLQANDDIVRAIREEKRLFFSFISQTVEVTNRALLPTFERERVKDYFIYKPRRSFIVTAKAKARMTHMAFWETWETRQPLGVLTAVGNPNIRPGDLIEPEFSFRIDIARFLQLEG